MNEMRQVSEKKKIRTKELFSVTNNNERNSKLRLRTFSIQPAAH